MNLQDLAEARSRLYGLAGNALLRGWIGEDRDAGRTLGLPIPEDPDDAGLDLEAAAFHRLFSQHAPPYPAVWLGSEALMGGPISARAADFLARCGLRSPPRDVEPDHLGLALRAVGFLAAAEADARRDGMDPRPLEELQREGLQTILLPAWCPFAAAVTLAGPTPFVPLVEIVGESLAQHAASIGATAGPAEAERVTPDDPLDDPKTGLRRIAAWLSTPSSSGFWLTTADLDAAAARSGSPRGFGARSEMAVSLLFAAVDHGTLPAVLGALGQSLDRWQEQYAQQRAIGLPADRWLERLGQTRRMLNRIHEATRESR